MKSKNKNLIIQGMIFFIVSVCLALASCNMMDGDSDIDMSKMDFSNIEDLYKQPLPVIQKAIRGKWKIVYARGGFIANMERYFDNSFVEFTSDNRYIKSYLSETKETAKFKWSKEKSYYAVEDFMYVMTFQNSYIIPLVMQEIHNDTLVFHQLVSDFERFYCVKSYLSHLLVNKI